MQGKNSGGLPQVSCSQWLAAKLPEPYKGSYLIEASVFQG